MDTEPLFLEVKYGPDAPHSVVRLNVEKGQAEEVRLTIFDRLVQMYPEVTVSIMDSRAGFALEFDQIVNSGYFAKDPPVSWDTVIFSDN